MAEIKRIFDQEQDAVLWEGLDTFSQLPAWLVAARDPDRIANVLSTLVKEFNSGQLLLKRCEVGHIRFKNNYWTGLYELTVCRSGETNYYTIVLEGEIYFPGALTGVETQVEGSLGSEGWHAVIPELNLKLKTQQSETVLSSLQFLTDPDQSRDYLMRLIQENSPQYRNLVIQSSNPKVVRYKPGSRCTVVYHLEYTPDRPAGSQWPEMVVAKIYRGNKGKNAFDSMLALWNSPLGSSRTVQIAEPLAYHDQERVMIQGPIREEQTLKSLVNSVFKAGTGEGIEALNKIMKKTAIGLAELHHSNVLLGKIWDWEDEMAEVRDRIDRLSAADPELAQAADPLLKRMNQLAAAYPADPLVPTHGSFRPAQVLLNKDQVGFIDFDSFCQSEPSNDLALFLSSVMSIGLTTSDFDEVRDSGVTMDNEMRKVRFEIANAVSENFLDEYEKYHPVSRQRVALWETLDIFMLVLHGWIKVKVGELGDVLYLLEQFLMSKKFVGPNG